MIDVSLSKAIGPRPSICPVQAQSQAPAVTMLLPAPLEDPRISLHCADTKVNPSPFIDIVIGPLKGPRPAISIFIGTTGLAFKDLCLLGLSFIH